MEEAAVGDGAGAANATDGERGREGLEVIEERGGVDGVKGTGVVPVREGRVGGQGWGRGEG